MSVQSQEVRQLWLVLSASWREHPTPILLTWRECREAERARIEHTKEPPR